MESGIRADQRIPAEFLALSAFVVRLWLAGHVDPWPNPVDAISRRSAASLDAKREPARAPHQAPQIDAYRQHAAVRLLRALPEQLTAECDRRGDNRCVR